MKKLQNREKVMLIAILVLLSVLVIKSTLLDEVKTENEMELKAITITAENSSYKSGFLIKSRVVGISEANTDVDTEEGAKELEYGYKIKIRDYLFGILPFRQWIVYI